MTPLFGKGRKDKPKANPEERPSAPESTRAGAHYLAGPPGQRLTPPDEEEAITGIALEQLAGRVGSAGEPKDQAIRRIDPASAEAMRDRAMREFMERKAQLENRNDSSD